MIAATRRVEIHNMLVALHGQPCGSRFAPSAASVARVNPKVREAVARLATPEAVRAAVRIPAELIHSRPMTPSSDRRC